MALATLGLVACAGPGAAPQEGRPGEVLTEPDESPVRKRARLRLALASAYYQQGQDAVALDELRQALASDALYAPAWNLRGLVYLRLAQWPLAEESMQRALALDPQDADAAHNYGWLLCQHPRAAERQAEAEALFRRALAQPAYAQPARTWAALSRCQQQAGRPAEAEASLRQALALAPADTGLALRLAQLLHARGQWQEAGVHLARLHAQGQGSAESLWLAIRGAHKLDNPALMQQLGRQLRQEFGRSREAQAFDKGLFDE